MPPIVKPMINGRVLAFGALFSAALAILCFGLSSWMISSDFSLGPGFPEILVLAPFLVLGVVSGLLALGSTWGAWFWLRLERRRQAAAWRSPSHTILATEQPSPPTVSLSLPMIISIRARWPMKLIVWPWAALLVISVAAGGAIDHGVWNVGFFLNLLAALAAGISLTLLFTGERQLEATDDHLAVRVGSRTKQAVPWEDAWLFAITRGRHATLNYEVASSLASVPWTWVRPGTISAYLFEPTVPQYEYDLQMEALLGLIAAKTGLPLNDLR
jgi:hypothetical protein